ncbi:gamma-glutamyltransferase, partial [Oscillibacter sp.]|uniref:gamma-glutamyltransferase n=1 Tax=Oscillibacter sp. TaxID=1945593 RepID=UPI002623D51E
MPQFDPLKYSFASHRNIVYAKKGMACSTSPIASQVGLEILKSGGNAMDAAVSMATTLPLVEPTGNGLGSDCFALVWTGGKLYGLDGSGVAPMALSAETIKDAGFTSVPMNGWMSTMVPGAPSAWAQLRRRFGTKPMQELMAPAIRYAREGFCIPVNVYKQWRAEVVRFTAAAEKEPEVYGPWVEYFTNGGKPYAPGDTFRNPDY